MSDARMTSIAEAFELWQEARRRIKTLEEAADGDRSEGDMDGAQDFEEAAVNSMFSQPAGSLADVLAKTRVLKHWAPCMIEMEASDRGYERDDKYLDQWALASILADIERLASGHA